MYLFIYFCGFQLLENGMNVFSMEKLMAEHARVLIYDRMETRKLIEFISVNYCE